MMINTVNFTPNNTYNTKKTVKMTKKKMSVAAAELKNIRICSCTHLYSRIYVAILGIITVHFHWSISIQIKYLYTNITINDEGTRISLNVDLKKRKKR